MLENLVYLSERLLEAFATANPIQLKAELLSDWVGTFSTGQDGKLRRTVGLVAAGSKLGTFDAQGTRRDVM